MMNKKIIVGIVLLSALIQGAEARAEFNRILDEQRDSFFRSLSDTHEINLAKECDGQQELPLGIETVWIEETRTAALGGRIPEYLKQIHCVIAYKSRTILNQYALRHRQSEAERTKFNLYSVIMLNAFHQAAMEKVNATYNEAFRSRFGHKIEKPVIDVQTFNYVNVFYEWARKLSKRFPRNIPPFEKTVALIKASDMYIDHDVNEAISIETGTVYEHVRRNQVQVVAYGISLTAERMVLLHFIQNMDAIFELTYQALVRGFNDTEKLKPDPAFLVTKQDIFAEKFVPYVSDRIGRFTQRVESNRLFALIGLSALDMALDKGVNQIVIGNAVQPLTEIDL